jgi:hypothetical protein
MTTNHDDGKEHGLLHEPAYIADVFADGIAYIERLGGGCVRIVFTVSEASIHDQTRQRVVVAKVVVPGEQLAALAKLAARRMEKSDGVQPFHH